jgi:hypothetical protein
MIRSDRGFRRPGRRIAGRRSAASCNHHHDNYEEYHDRKEGEGIAKHPLIFAGDTATAYPGKSGTANL